MANQKTIKNFKNVLGWSLVIILVNTLYPIQIINKLQFIHLPIMAISAYFLIMSGDKR